MRQFINLIWLTLVVMVLFSCDSREFKKPDNLIPKKKMINMLADIHLAKAYQQNIAFNDSIELTSTDLYYSVLEKYKEADSVFVKSVIYYSSYPKMYERMYNDVLNILQEMEKETMDDQELNIGNKPDKLKKLEDLKKLE